MIFSELKKAQKNSPKQPALSRATKQKLIAYQNVITSNDKPKINLFQYFVKQIKGEK
ncbi:hypothetical protein OXT66_03075 [Lentilactobacillus senioris]|uniref:hypothetical protein n=1 Tax=Lentilactobacillus senioris TaxID=931534 RepID=UPI00227F519E|nr:hypothetical protein [Lentilactobacillus senioris]MCY9806531.1 hypothetical protein [Lentilactobacillus senioris]